MTRASTAKDSPTLAGGLLWLFFLWFPRRGAAVLPILLAVLFAGPAEAGAGRVAPVCPSRSDTSGALWAVADFDGDNVVDLARIEVSRQGDDVTTSGIELFSLCSTSLPPMLGAFQRTGLVFSARDVDVDNDLDLVLREQFAGRALALWLNDGKGGFSPAEPPRFPGAGDDPPGLAPQTRRVHPPAASTSTKSHLAVPHDTGFFLFAPLFRRRNSESATGAVSVSPDTRRSRAPPVPLFLTSPPHPVRGFSL